MAPGGDRRRPGFGAGALISSVSFELASEGFTQGGALPLAIGLAAGALAFFVADRGVVRLGGRLGTGSAGLALALGALLDGVPEQTVLGLGIAEGKGVSIAFLVAIFVSNLPESVGSSTGMKAAGESPPDHHPVDRSRDGLHLGLARRIRDLAGHGGAVRGRSRRLRGRRPSGHAGRFDDSGGH